MANPTPARAQGGSACADCRRCFGNGVGDDGDWCQDCEGTGCSAYPFCTADHDSEADWAEATGVCKHGGPAPCMDDICHALGGCMLYEGGR